MYYTATTVSPIGTLTLASNGEELVGLWIAGQKYHGGRDQQNHASILTEALPAPLEQPPFDAAVAWLACYFAGEKPSITKLPLAPVGSEFQLKVWDLLRQIPYGELTTYGALARQLAAASGKLQIASQAVGGAVGRNQLSIMIPCHRVVGANGSLVGYGGGIQTKIKLLELEGVDLTDYFVPKTGTAL